MPHSLSLPFQSVLSPETTTTPPYRTMLSPEELEKVFEGVMGRERWLEVKEGKRGIVSTCGSGMTVSFPSLSLVGSWPLVSARLKLTHRDPRRAPGFDPLARPATCRRRRERGHLRRGAFLPFALILQPPSDFFARSQSWTGYAARPESVIEKS